jgi:hypothetical protein
MFMISEQCWDDCHVGYTIQQVNGSFTSTKLKNQEVGGMSGVTSLIRMGSARGLGFDFWMPKATQQEALL